MKWYINYSLPLLMKIKRFEGARISGMACLYTHTNTVEQGGKFKISYNFCKIFNTDAWLNGENAGLVTHK